MTLAPSSVRTCFRMLSGLVFSACCLLTLGAQAPGTFAGKPVKETVSVKDLKAGYNEARKEWSGGHMPESTKLENDFIAFMNLAEATDVPSLRLAYHSSSAGTPDVPPPDRTFGARVFLPRRTVAAGPTHLPLVIYIHGTETRHDAVPSTLKGDETWLGAAGAEMMDMAVAMPDLPGLGPVDTAGRHHPYFHGASLVPSVIDLIRAVLGPKLQGAPEVFDGKEYVWDHHLFIMGYSEGGFIAMAALRALQLDPVFSRLGIKVDAAACMAGPFDFPTSAQKILGGSASLARPYIQADLLVSWAALFPKAFPLARTANPRLLENRTSGVDQGSLVPWLSTDLAGSEITARLQARLTGDKTKAVTARDIVAPAWIAALASPATADPAIVQAKMAIAMNQLVGGWAPRYPVLLAQDPGDEVVDYANTLAIYESWVKAGVHPMAPKPLRLPDGKHPGHTWGAMMAVPMAFWQFKSYLELERMRAALAEARRLAGDAAGAAAAVAGDLGEEFKRGYDEAKPLEHSAEETFSKIGSHMPSIPKPKLPSINLHKLHL